MNIVWKHFKGFTLFENYQNVRRISVIMIQLVSNFSIVNKRLCRICFKIGYDTIHVATENLVKSTAGLGRNESAA